MTSAFFSDHWHWFAFMLSWAIYHLTQKLRLCCQNEGKWDSIELNWMKLKRGRLGGVNGNEYTLRQKLDSLATFLFGPFSRWFWVEQRNLDDLKIDRFMIWSQCCLYKGSCNEVYVSSGLFPLPNNDIFVLLQWVMRYWCVGL